MIIVTTPDGLQDPACRRADLDERFQWPGYRTDGELAREVTQIAELLADPGVFLNDAQREHAGQRLKALKAEQEDRRRARARKGGDRA